MTDHVSRCNALTSKNTRCQRPLVSGECPDHGTQGRGRSAAPVPAASVDAERAAEQAAFVGQVKNDIERYADTVTLMGNLHRDIKAANGEPWGALAEALGWDENQTIQEIKRILDEVSEAYYASQEEDYEELCARLGVEPEMDGGGDGERLDEEWDMTDQLGMRALESEATEQAEVLLNQVLEAAGVPDDETQQFVEMAEGDAVIRAIADFTGGRASEMV